MAGDFINDPGNLPTFLCHLNLNVSLDTGKIDGYLSANEPTFEAGGVPQSQAPGLVKDRRLNPVQVRLGEAVVHVIEEGELIVDLRNPVVVSGVLALSNLVNLLLKLLQS